MTDSTETIESTDRNAGITDAGARRLLFGSTVFSIIVGFAWGWCLYPSFEDPRIFNVIGLVMITVVFFVTLFVGLRAWWSNRDAKSE